MGDESLKPAVTTADVVARIARYNAGREPERLAIKYDALRRDPFTFLRGTAHLFWEDWQALHGVPPDAPLVWGTGDLHLENVGSFRGDNWLVYFDLNDFDEGARIPATWELARFIASVHVGAESLGVGRIARWMLGFEKTCDSTQLLARSARWSRATANETWPTLLTSKAVRAPA